VNHLTCGGRVGISAVSLLSVQWACPSSTDSARTSSTYCVANAFAPDTTTTHIDRFRCGATASTGNSIGNSSIRTVLAASSGSTPSSIIDDDSKDPLDLLQPRSDFDVDQIGPAQLAFVGDIVYELYVRCRYVWPARRTADLQTTVVGIVRAETQSKLLASMMKSFPFTGKERSILTRGRNSGTGSRGRKRGKEWGAIYQDSTAFEALIGYSYMSDRERCFEILNWIRNEQDKIDENDEVNTSDKAKDAPYNSLRELLQPRCDCEVDQVAPAQLAYIGDSVYELLARNKYVWPHRRTADLHRIVVSMSRAETQALICKSLTDENSEMSRQIELTPKETSILLRGRNAAGGSNGRNKQVKKAARKPDDGTGAAMHQDAAALEALLAYSFISNPRRCYGLLQLISDASDVVGAGEEKVK